MGLSILANDDTKSYNVLFPKYAKCLSDKNNTPKFLINYGV